WYHGKLDRTIAEERLRQARTPGSYLIRESDRRPGSFVLSFLSMTNVVNHFRIIAMCGDYYIGGRRFCSLSDLIGYYSYVSCLLKGEKLLSPVAPPEIVEGYNLKEPVSVQHFSEEQYIFYFAGEVPEQAQVSSLVLYVEEAHKLPVKYFTNPYCNIYLNSVQVAKTYPREGQNPVFTEEFIFETAHYWQASSCGSSDTRRLKHLYLGHSMTEKLTWRHVLKKLLAITELLQQKQAQYAMSNSNR
ncbi:hypothetical protein GOODEAATRI_005370, partial [Goodea atripinnis]